MAAVVLALVLAFARQMRVLQGQAERSAVQSTLGALRSAFVLDHLQQMTRSETRTVASMQHNPFELLEHYPANYFGTMSASQASAMPAGGWVFEPACICVGYLPVRTEWLDRPDEDPILWYRVGDASAPLQLTARQAYVWHGQALN